MSRRIAARSFLAFLPLLVLTAAEAAKSAAPKPPSTSRSAAPAPAARCTHGVKASLCTRCNPKLIPVFKAKKDWCAEHERPESQCVLCHPDLAKEGVR